MKLTELKKLAERAHESAKEWHDKKWPTPTDYMVHDCFAFQSAATPQQFLKLIETIEKLRAGLEKIADPRKRDHKEPDDYTEKCCLMHIANELLKETEGV